MNGIAATKRKISLACGICSRLLDDPVIGQKQLASASGNDGE